MTHAPRCGLLLLVALGAALTDCAPVTDVVFETLGLEQSAGPLVLREGAGVVELPLRLSATPSNSVSANYRVREIDAQDTCQVPDFLSAEGTVTWAAGSRDATVTFWVGDDDLAELDERLALSLTDVEGAVLLGSAELPLLIEDDDRSGIVDASAEFGLAPGKTQDQSAALQSALDRAGRLGRGVVQVTAGDYEISSVSVSPGTTLSARGARLHRPAHAVGERAVLSIAHSSSSDSLPTLIEGLTLDGRRDEQVSYQAGEGIDAHLLWLSGDGERAGRLHAAVENVTLEEATGSGMYIGPQADVRACRIRGSDLWRDVVTLRGGGSNVDLRELDASASIGTTGMWFAGQPEGFGGVRTIDVKLSDARLASGDLEIEGYGGSNIVIERLSMTRGPLRIQAPNARVRILDSVLESGLPSELHNFWGLPHDIEVTRTTLVVSETDAEGLDAPEASRALAAVSVRWELDNDSSPPAAAASGPHQLLFDQCVFQRGADLDPNDQVYALESIGSGGRVVLRAASLGPGVEALLPPCATCSSEP
jgi:hypothetical protein